MGQGWSRAVAAGAAAVVAVALGGPVGCSVARMHDRALHRRAGRLGLEARALHTDAVDLYYHAGGAARAAPRPLLVLHGFGGDGLTTWSAQLAPFAETRSLLVPDLLWFGRSLGHERPGLDAQVAAMVALLDQEGIAQVDVMGISYGGFVALGLLAQAPERVARLVVVDSPGPAFGADDQAAMLDRLGVARADEVFVPDDTDDLRRLLALTWADPPPAPTWVLRDVLAEHFAVNHGPWRALLAELPTHRDQVARAVADHPRPALVVWGAGDQVFPVESGARLARMLDGELVVIPDTAHGPSAERPAVFNAAVLDWLAAGEREAGDGG